MGARRGADAVLLAFAGLAWAGLPPMAGIAAAQDLPPPAEGKPDLAALKKELEETYLQIQRDFESLTGEKAAPTIRSLETAVGEESKSRSGGTVRTEEFPGVWTSRGLLGPVVAGRLAARLPEATAKAAEEKAGGQAPLLSEALRLAVKLVFPEASMADNWDRHFVDLDVVQRWAKARGSAAGGPGPEKAPEPGKSPPPAGPDPADMVLVPKGELLVPEDRGRGWPNLGQKAERRTVKPFYLDRTEVTGAAYAAFLREVKDAKLRERILPSGWKADEKGAPVLPEGTASLPVAGIPYEGAAAFAASLGKRLPTEDEWERAARGNQGLKYPWGNEWVEGNAAAGGRPGPAPAGTTAADRSPFGILDMVGNVSELCATYPDGKPVKGLPKATEQVVRRGGNFKEPGDEAAGDWRYVIGPTARSELVGFRCAMDEKDYERRYGKR